MDRTQTGPIAFQRNVIVGLLLALAAAAWAALVWQGAGADADMAMDSPTMGLRAPLFLTTWVIMMVAINGGFWFCSVAWCSCSSCCQQTSSRLTCINLISI